MEEVRKSGRSNPEVGSWETRTKLVLGTVEDGGEERHTQAHSFPRLSSRMRLHMQQGFQEKWVIMNKFENLDDRFLEKEKFSKILKESGELKLESEIHVFPPGRRQAWHVLQGIPSKRTAGRCPSLVLTLSVEAEKEAGTVFTLEMDRGSSGKANGGPVSA